MDESQSITAAFEEEELDVAPVEEGLERVTPAAPEADLQKLEEEAAQHRVLLMRGGAVVAVSTLVSVGGALMLHSFFGGIIVLGMLFHWGTPGGGRGGGNPAKGDETVIISGDEDVPDAGDAAQQLANLPAASNDAPALAKFGPLPEVSPPASEKSVVTQGVGLAMPQSEDFGHIRASMGAKTGGGAAKAGVPNGTEGSDDEPVFNYVAGRGTGPGRGNGLDRGISAANRDARLLEFDGNFTLPMKYQVRPPAKSVKLKIEVLPDGSMGDITVAQSCGVAEIDQRVVANMRENAKFSPAYEAGRAISSTFEFEQSFGPQDQ